MSSWGLNDNNNQDFRINTVYGDLEENKRRKEAAQQKLKQYSANIKQYDDITKCPTCGQGAQLTCNCIQHDSKCGNGHWWHFENGIRKLGKGTH